MSLGIVTGLTAEARLAAPLGHALAGGGLPPGARRAAEALVAKGARALLSFGLAGGLDPALPPGTLLIPTHVLHRGDALAADPALLRWLGGSVGGTLLADEHVVAEAAEKARLFHATGAAAIDLESGEVARVALEHGLPFAALRAICDPAGRCLPPAALVALNAAGAIGGARVLLSVLRAPGQIPHLLRLAGDAARARRVLSKFVHDLVSRNASPPFTVSS